MGPDRFPAMSVAFLMLGVTLVAAAPTASAHPSCNFAVVNVAEAGFRAQVWTGSFDCRGARAAMPSDACPGPATQGAVLTVHFHAGPSDDRGSPHCEYYLVVYPAGR